MKRSTTYHNIMKEFIRDQVWLVQTKKIYTYYRIFKNNVVKSSFSVICGSLYLRVEMFMEQEKGAPGIDGNSYG